MRRALQVTHRSNPTQEAKATTAKMPTAGLGVGVPATDAAPCVLEGGEQEPSLRGLELAEGREPDPHRLRPANNAALNNLALALIKRSGKLATVPQGMAHYTATREAALEALLTRQKGIEAHAVGQPSEPGAAHLAAHPETVPWGIQNPSENQIDLRYRQRSISVFGFKLHHACLVHERHSVSLSQAAE